MTLFLWNAPVVGQAAAGLFWLGWWIDVPILDWILMIGGGFFFTVVVFLFVIALFGPKDNAGRVARPALVPAWLMPPSLVLLAAT